MIELVVAGDMLIKCKYIPPIADTMDGKFALGLICACAAAFAATWSFMGEPGSSSARPAGAQPTGETLVFETCEEARAAGQAPLMAGRPGYNPDLDPDGTGLACPPLQ